MRGEGGGGIGRALVCFVKKSEAFHHSANRKTKTEAGRANLKTFINLSGTLVKFQGVLLAPLIRF